MAFNTPILLITFNRPERVRVVLTEIRKQQPAKLYVFQDGARKDRPDDIEKCKAVRDAVSDLVDWPCELHTNYQKNNLGCGPGPFTAISWFFENEEYGIIMEDDIYPHPLFFRYCDELLAKYADETRIGAVMGHNFYRKYSTCNSYYYTFDTEGTLGWATWRRVWGNVRFDVEVNAADFDLALKKNYGFPKPYRERETNHFVRVLDCDRHDRWDYQLEYCLKLNGYINIKPNSCLTSHEGDDSDATHEGYTNPNYKMDVHEERLLPIKHPKKIKIARFEKRAMYVKSLKIYIKGLLRK